jgi:hypothetical protein
LLYGFSEKGYFFEKSKSETPDYTGHGSLEIKEQLPQPVVIYHIFTLLKIFQMEKTKTCILIMLQFLTVKISAQIIPDSLRTDWSYAGLQNFYVDTSNVVNVLNFGAAGNGISNDYAAIVNAVNSLNGNSGIVYFPAGSVPL